MQQSHFVQIEDNEIGLDEAQNTSDFPKIL